LCITCWWVCSHLAAAASAAELLPSLLAQAYMERVHAPLLMNPLVQAIVVALFITGTHA
jgi:hypothetical protein